MGGGPPGPVHGGFAGRNCRAAAAREDTVPEQVPFHMPAGFPTTKKIVLRTSSELANSRGLGCLRGPAVDKAYGSLRKHGSKPGQGRRCLLMILSAISAKSLTQDPARATRAEVWDCPRPALRCAPQVFVARGCLSLLPRPLPGVHRDAKLCLAALLDACNPKLRSP